MAANRNSSERILDVITEIKKVGSMDDENAEIFMVLHDHGSYSFDKFVYPRFEDFWLNAKIGSSVIVTEDSGGSVNSVQMAPFTQQ